MKTAQSAKCRSAAFRIISVLAVVLIAEWVFPLMFGRQPWAFISVILALLMFGFFTHRALGETPRDLGLRLDNFSRSVRFLGLPMLVAVGILASVGYGFGSLGMPASPHWHDFRNYLWLLWWGLLQQYALQAIVNRQAQIIWGRGSRSVLVVGSIFGVLHLPNTALVIATLAGGLIWAYVYQRVPNLLALALSHSAMTVFLLWALPQSVLHGLRVGLGYYR